jgi:hypothetical protein
MIDAVQVQLKEDAAGDEQACAQNRSRLPQP